MTVDASKTLTLRVECDDGVWIVSDDRTLVFGDSGESAVKAIRNYANDMESYCKVLSEIRSRHRDDKKQFKLLKRYMQ